MPTPAERQIELLKRLKAAPPSADAEGVQAEPEDAGAAPTEAPEETRGAPPSGPLPRALPVSEVAWRRLVARQRASREFGKLAELGEWAAELVLALPPGASRMSKAEKSELFRRMAQWCEGKD
jgi:hypothetical protein